MTPSVAIMILGVAGATPCERPTTGADVEVAVVRAREAFASEDTVALAAAVAEGQTALECIVEPVGPELSEAVHLAMGLWASVERGDASAVPYLAACRLPRSSGSLGVALSEAETSLVRRLTPALGDWSLVQRDPIAPPLRGRVALDGDERTVRPPENAPFVLQRISRKTVISTSYVAPEGRPPTYVRRRPVLIATTSTLAVGTAGLLLGAATFHSQVFADHRDAPLTGDQIQTLQSRNHALLLTAAATGAGGLASGTALALSYRW